MKIVTVLSHVTQETKSSFIEKNYTFVILLIDFLLNAMDTNYCW